MEEMSIPPSLKKDYSKMGLCPKISDTSMLSPSARNLFREFPCKYCTQYEIRREKAKEGTLMSFECKAHNGKSIEIMFYPNGTSQQNFSSIALE